MWCDAEANCHRLSSRVGVADIVEKAKRASIGTLIVDVKPLVGEVLYASKHAPRLGEVDGRKFPESFDLLAAMVEEGHSRGINVHAAVNVFSEGHREWGRGPAYERPEWQMTMYEAVRTVRFSSGLSLRVEILDPWHPSDLPAIYTRKSGGMLSCDPGKRCIAISGSAVAAVTNEPGTKLAIPEDGCVLCLPDSGASRNVKAGDRVTFRSEPVFRSAAESRISSYGIFVNPIGSARDYELQIIEEIASNYDIDGIVFDRMRYPNLYADFGPASREAFEAWLGHGPIRWPDDVFAIADFPWLPPDPGRYYKEWLEWRAWQIRDFADEAVRLVRSIRPGVKSGVYVGSWYESYYDVGVNWGSSKFHAGYPWMTPEYNRTGFAELFDYICTGCYYPVPTREEARAAGRPEGATVEAACQLSCEAISGACPAYGSIYLRDYEDNPEGFRKAIETAVSNSDGVMLFDLVYLEDYGWWPIVEEEFAIQAVAPHESDAQPG